MSVINGVPTHMLFPRSTEIVAIENANWQLNNTFTSHYCDWFYIGSHEAMWAIVDTRSFHIDYSVRCFQLCQEEQVEYHVTMHNFSFTPANVSDKLLTLDRMECRPPTTLRAVQNRSH